MRLLKKISIAAALAGLLLVGTGSIPPAQQADEASELNKRVIDLYSAGRYSDAIPIAQQALAIREKALGRDHPDVATWLNNLAGLYVSQGCAISLVLSSPSSKLDPRVKPWVKPGSSPRVTDVECNG
jgi:hypothetical protein